MTPQEYFTDDECITYTKEEVTNMLIEKWKEFKKSTITILSLVESLNVGKTEALVLVANMLEEI